MEELTELVKSIDKRAWQTRAMAYLLFCCLEKPSKFLLNQLSDATCLLFDMLTAQETEIGLISKLYWRLIDVGQCTRVMELIAETRRKADKNYTMRVGEMQAIYEAGPNTWNVMCNAFYYGYLKEQRALRAEMKRKRIP